MKTAEIAERILISFVVSCLIILFIQSTQAFKKYQGVEDFKDYDGLDRKNVLKDPYIWQGKYNRRMNPLGVRNIRVFKIMKTNDEEKLKQRGYTDISIKELNDMKSESGVRYKSKKTPKKSVILCQRHGMERNRPSVYRYIDNIDTRRNASDKNNDDDDDYAVNITTADTSIYSDANHSSVSINDQILRGSSENVVPNDIFIAKEKDCANWHKDCNTMGVKNDLFKILWSRYNS